MIRLATLLLSALMPGLAAAAAADRLAETWPGIDLAAAGLEPESLYVYGPRNVVPSYDDPALLPAGIASHVAGLEPVIAVEIDGEMRGYPMRIVAAHGIVNDTLAGVPIAVSYCRACSSAMVFDRRVAGQASKFGTAGVLYEQNMVMFDAASGTWWQQINGLGLAGPQSARSLDIVPSTILSAAIFKSRVEQNPGALMAADSELSQQPLASRDAFDLPEPTTRHAGLSPVERVVVVGRQAWPLALLRRQGRVETDELLIVWEPGREAAPDLYGRDEGEDVGNITFYHRDERADYDGKRVAEDGYRVNLLHAFERFTEGGRLNLGEGAESLLPDGRGAAASGDREGER